MKLLRIPVVLLVLLACLSTYRVQALLAQTTPDEGEMFPDLKLSIPQRMEEREYLKIYEGPFQLSQVDSDVLIVQIYSMYCPYCQKEAPNINALQQAISTCPEIKSHVKIIGIGAGNSIFEVNAYRDLFRIEFPLIPDSDFSVHKALGEVRTPYYFVLSKKASGLKVVYSRVGSIGDPMDFLELVCARTGISRGK
ncbi:MAG: TlpA disulfide reductase family protein [Syntrophobacteraceae bacterium]|jgi:thiol-disulfide isomerase/thioredoxin